MVIAFVGSGGKTTLIHRMAEDMRRSGQKVLVTTSTRMYIEEDTILSADAAQIMCELNEKGYAMAGVPHGEKIGPLPEEVYLEVCGYADAVLVEADGSKGLPLKFPAEHEPVIYENTDEIIVVCGLKSVGKPAKEVCHRLEEVKKCLGIGGDTLIEEEHVMRLLEKGYLEPLRKRFPGKKISVHPVHDGSREDLARRIMEMFE